MDTYHTLPTLQLPTRIWVDFFVPKDSCCVIGKSHGVPILLLNDFTLVFALQVCANALGLQKRLWSGGYLRFSVNVFQNKVTENL